MCCTARTGLANLYIRWRYEEEYGYGFLVTALVPLLLWRRWPSIVSDLAGSRWPGVAIVAAGQLFCLLGVLGESYFLEQIALILSILGVGTTLFGAGSIPILIPIAVLLLLTVPLPYTLEAILTIKLQLMSTNIGVAIIQVLGIPVYAEGNIIDLGTYKLQVAEACSGLRYLLPLTCISYLLAYLYRTSLWKKAIVVISAIPMTVLLNSVRIAITAVLINFLGTQAAEGFLHQFEGWAVFMIGVLLLVFEIFTLEGFRWSRVKIEPMISQPSVASQSAQPVGFILPGIVALVICGSAFAAAASIRAALQTTPSPARESFVDFPRQIGGWIGRPVALEPDVLEKLKASDTYSGDFTYGRDALPINLFVAYYSSLSEGAAIHSPRVCLPGLGWEFVSFQERKFSEVEPGLDGTYYRVQAQKGEQKILMYYWYQQRERRTADEFGMKYYLLIDNIFSGRKDGGLVRLLAPIDITAGDAAQAEADARLRAFLRVVITKLPSYLPK